MADKEVDVIIVGGGLSGLSAATLLQKNNASCLVLEARDRVGGRTCTEYTTSTTGERLSTDAGGAYVGPTQNYLLRVAKTVGIETYKIYAKGRSVMEHNGKLSSYEGTIPTLPPHNLIDMNYAIRTFGYLAETVNLESPERTPNASKLDKITIDQWVKQNLWTSTARDMMGHAVRSLLCKEMHEVSFLYWLWFIKNAGNPGDSRLNRLLEIHNGAQERKFIGGSMTISSKVAEALGEGVVRLNAPVARIIRETNGPVIVECRNGSRHKCEAVILAFAPTLYNTISFSPPLSPNRSKLAQRMSMGCIIKTTTFYPRAWWREAGYYTMLSDANPVTFCMDDCKPDGSQPALMGFVFSREARRWSRRPNTDRELLQEIHAQYKRLLSKQGQEVPEPCGFIAKNWIAEEFSRGGYLASPGPGVVTDPMYRNLREPEDRLFFAGTETAACWVGYMDGAIEAGERAAYQVLEFLANRGRSVNIPKRVLPQPESEEVPAKPINLDFLERNLPSLGSIIYSAMLIPIGGLLGGLLYYRGCIGNKKR